MLLSEIEPGEDEWKGSIVFGITTNEEGELSNAQLFQKLEALAKNDPAEFKETTAAMAKTVQDAADAASDPRETQKRTELAKKFTQASETGDARRAQATEA